jgi:hypothetical protein
MPYESLNCECTRGKTPELLNISEYVGIENKQSQKKDNKFMKNLNW